MSQILWNHTNTNLLLVKVKQHLLWKFLKSSLVYLLLITSRNCLIKPGYLLAQTLPSFQWFSLSSGCPQENWQVHPLMLSDIDCWWRCCCCWLQRRQLLLHFPSPVESYLWPLGQGGATVSVVKAPGAPCSPQYFGCEGVLALLHYFGVGSLKKDMDLMKNSMKDGRPTVWPTLLARENLFQNGLHKSTMTNLFLFHKLYEKQVKLRLTTTSRAKKYLVKLVLNNWNRLI